MTEQGVLQRLRDLKDGDAAGLQQLTQDCVSACKEPVRTILDVWLQEGRHTTLCAFLCSQLTDLASGELLQRVEGAPVERRVHFMEMVVAQQLLFREYLLVAIEALLENHTPAGEAASGLRTCDGAYMLARRVVPLKPEAAKEFSTESGFLGLPEPKRTEEIKRWKGSDRWREIFPR